MLVYIAYINHHIRPAVYMGLASAAEPVMKPERLFMQACDIRAMEKGDIPVKLVNFTKKEGAHGK